MINKPGLVIVVKTSMVGLMIIKGWPINKFTHFKGRGQGVNGFVTTVQNP